MGAGTIGKTFNPSPVSPLVDPRWNPFAMIGVGGLFVLIAFFTSSAYHVVAVYSVMSLGGLILLGGVVLAYIETFRHPSKEPMRWGRR